MQAGEKYLVRVHGWIMLAKVESGDYRIELSNFRNIDRLTATFYRPRGKKPITRHYVDDIIMSEGCNNRMEILKKLD